MQERSINRYYDPSTDQFLSVDPMVDTTGQPYAFVNDNPLNSTDPLGLKGWYCFGGESHYYAGNKFGPATGKCGSIKNVTVVKNAVNDYVNSTSSNFNYMQGCFSALFAEACVSVTPSGAAYWSVGVGAGLPGPTVSVSQTRGKTTDQALKGWSTCADVAWAAGYVHCWNTPGNGSTNGLEGSAGPTVGVFVTYGRRFGL